MVFFSSSLFSLSFSNIIINNNSLPCLLIFYLSSLLIFLVQHFRFLLLCDKLTTSLIFILSLSLSYFFSSINVYLPAMICTCACVCVCVYIRMYPYDCIYRDTLYWFVCKKNKWKKRSYIFLHRLNWKVVEMISQLNFVLKRLIKSILLVHFTINRILSEEREEKEYFVFPLETECSTNLSYC